MAFYYIELTAMAFGFQCKTTFISFCSLARARTRGTGIHYNTPIRGYIVVVVYIFGIALAYFRIKWSTQKAKMGNNVSLV